MSRVRKSFGDWGEGLAAEFLQDQGYSLLARNQRTPYGKIDLIARQTADDRSVIVFVEVKTRSSSSFGLPEEAITPRKQEHMLSAAQFYLQQHPELDQDWRIDVIAVERYNPDKPPQITHFENAIR